MKLIHIQKTYHNRNNTVHALKGIDLDLSTNGIIVILGPSGCGKTTLLNIMAGRLSYEGRIEDVPSFDYLTQEFNLFENMSVKDNLLLVSDNREKLDFYLDVFDMSDQMDKKVKKLSNGQKKRVQFIRALLHQPGLLLCDEPTAALDRDNAVKLMDELKKLSDEVQIILVTHDILLSRQYADRIITMEQGVIVGDEIIHEKGRCYHGTEIEHKTVKETALLSYRRLVSTVTGTLMQLMLMMLAVLTMFTVFNMYANVRAQSDYADTFKQAKNLIVSVPKNREANHTETYSGYAVKYTDLTYSDLFDYSQIVQAVQDHPEIIGVESFNSYQYQQDYELEDLRFEDDSQAYQTFDFHGKQFPDFPLESPFIIRSDFEPYEDWDEYVSKEYRNYYSSMVSVFDLVNGYEDLPLLAGTMPEDDGIVLSRNAADMLMEIDGYTSYEQMVGKTMKLALRGYRNSAYYLLEDQWPISLIDVKIAGISSVENDFMTMVFFNSGFGNNPVYDYFVKDPTHMKLQYVRFLLKPGSDYERVAEELDAYFDKINVDISVFSGQGLREEVRLYQSPAGLVVYAGILFVVIVCVLVLYLFAGRKRMIKGKQIMEIYGYSIMQESMIRNVAMTILAFILSVLVSIPFSKLVNDFAAAHYYQPFMTFNLPVLMLFACGMGIAVILLETGMTYRRKHDQY